jgi:geranylgeranylglycerol-phosphate geranylgeranyltransferase
MRPFNCALITLCAIVGIMVDNGVETFFVRDNGDILHHWPSLLMIFIGGWALSAAAMVLNDYFDIEIDKINDPDRPIPSGKIKPKQALRFGIILITIGVLMSIGIDTYEWLVFENQFGVSIVTAVLCAVMVSTYTNYMKKYSILGNLAVSVGVWMGFLYGDLVFNFNVELLPQAMGCGAFMLNFGREVAKGIIDVEGDRENNVTTVATALGGRWTAIVASSFWVIAIAAALSPIFLAGASVVYFATILPSLVLAFVAIIWIQIDFSIPAIKKIKKMVLWTMFFCLISFTLEGFLGPGLLPFI